METTIRSSEQQISSLKISHRPKTKCLDLDGLSIRRVEREDVIQHGQGVRKLTFRHIAKSENARGFGVAGIERNDVTDDRVRLSPMPKSPLDPVARLQYHNSV